MDFQVLFNLAIGLAGGLMGFVLKAVWDGVRELRDAVAARVVKVQGIEVLVAGAYIKRDEFEKLSQAIFTKLDKISEKLDSKANKSECDRYHDRVTS